VVADFAHGLGGKCARQLLLLLLSLLLQNVLYELSLAEATGMRSREAENEPAQEMDTGIGSVG
jgi:hypothetical protein